MSLIKEKLKNYLKYFTVKELKREVQLLKKQFQVSKMTRHEVKQVILNHYNLFIHLLEKKQKVFPTDNFNQWVKIQFEEKE